VSSGQWLVKDMKTMFAILVLLSASLAQEVVQPWQIPCREEGVQANLDVKSRHRVFGQLKDPTGAPFQDSTVLLRKQTEKGKFVEYRSVLTDKDGRFDLKTVGPGEYRLLPGPNRGWKQPKSVACGDKSECELKLILELNPDQPFAGCPIQ
jgi:hypothetical protein